jgi:ribosomal protein S27E
MPFIGTRDGETVIPEGVENGTVVTCPECGEEMHPWGPSVDGRARHFQHYSDRECATAGGESATHRKLKSIAVSKLRTIFDERAAVCEPEVTLEAPKSDAADRRADALVRFDERDEQLGNGLIIEVQYKNKGKDRRATERDYLAQDYAVVWVTPDDYEDNELTHTERSIRLTARHAAIDHFHTFAKIPHDAPEPVSDTLDLSLTDAVAPATIIKDWVIESPREHWKSEGWDAAFRSPDGHYAEQNHTASGLVASLPASTKPTASVPEPARDRLLYDSDRWVRQKHDNAEFFQPLVFDPSLPFSFVFEHLSNSDKLITADLSRPPTRFDDVQCLGCGNYQYAPNAGLLCPTCGKPYDWEWNVETGRIKQESIPDNPPVR